MDPILATWAIKVVARHPAPLEPALAEAGGADLPDGSYGVPPTNAELEAAIVKGLGAELGLTVTATAERTDK